MKKIFAFVVFALMISSVFAQIEFEKIYGGNGNDEGRCVKQTYDGGYIIAGSTSSFGAGLTDVYLLKVDSEGTLQWQKTFGGTGIDEGYSLDITNDSGFIICGYTNSFGSGGYDAYLIRTDSIGDTLWTKTYGGSDWDFGYSVKHTTDGGFIIAGGTYSYGAGNEDAWVVKLDANGNYVWSKTFGGINDDVANDIQQITDSGFVVCGTTLSFGAGDKDMYVIRLNFSGDSLWTKTYGGIDTEEANSIAQTPDTGYIIAGYTNTFSWTGYESFYLVKTNMNGDTLWTMIEGATDNKRATSIVPSYNGGYTLTGVTTGQGDPDVLFWQTHADGTWQSSGSAGALNPDMGYSIQQTTDHGFIIVGYTNSYGTYPPYVFLVKTDSTGHHPSVISVNELHASNGVFVYPNPFNTSATIKIETKYHQNTTLQLYSVLGLKVREYEMISPKGEFQIQRGNLESGIYFYHITLGQQEVAVGKIIIE